MRYFIAAFFVTFIPFYIASFANPPWYVMPFGVWALLLSGWFVVKGIAAQS